MIRVSTASGACRPPARGNVIAARLTRLTVAVLHGSTRAHPRCPPSHTHARTRVRQEQMRPSPPRNTPPHPPTLLSLPPSNCRSTACPTTATPTWSSSGPTWSCTCSAASTASTSASTSRRDHAEMRGKGREGAGGGGGVGVECAYGERQWRGSWGEGSEGINNTFPEGRLAESCSERDGGTEGRKEGTKGGMGAPVRAGEGGGEGGPEIEKDLSFALVRLSPFTSLHFSVEAVVVCASGSHWPAGRRLARREPPDRRPTVPSVPAQWAPAAPPRLRPSSRTSQAGC